MGVFFIIALLIAASLHVVAARINAQTARENKIHAGSRSPSTTLPEILAQVQAPAPPAINLDAKPLSLPVIQTGGRTFVGTSLTPEYLVGLFEGHTSLQAKKLVEPYIGKWIVISGNLKHVSSTSPGHAFVTFEGRGIADKAAGVNMFFNDNKWVERLSILRLADSLTVAGKIKDINQLEVDLEDCEVID